MSQPDVASDPKVKEITAETKALVEKAATYTVATAEQYERAATDLQMVKGARDRLEKLRKSFTAPLDQAKKAIMDFFRKPTEDLERAELQIKRAMLAYTDEQRRRQLEEQRKADEAARKEQEKLRQQAARAAESGKIEKAEVLQQRAASVVAPVIQREPPKVAGITTRKAWKFEVTDPAQVPREYLTVDESKIRKVVAALGAQTNIPGVRVWSEDVIASAKGAA